MVEAAQENQNKSTLLEQVLWVEWISPEYIKILSEVGKLPSLKVGEAIAIHDIVKKNDVDKVKDCFSNLSHGSATVQFALKIGNTQSISINCIALKDDDKTIALWKIGDIEKNDSLQLLATAAHDLRSPINSIIGLTNVLQLMLKEDNLDPKEFSRMVGMIKTSCNNALDFSSELLELSEIESKNYHLETETVAVNNFIKGFIDTHRLVTLKKGIKVKLESSLDHDTTFLINENKLTRVLANLLSNATKFSHPNGTIFFNVECDEQSIIVSVVDQGVGMPPKIVDSLFVKFGNSKRIGLDGEKSHGLGMSIVKQIVHLHDGKIKVKSKEGEGTSISLIFRKNN